MRTLRATYRLQLTPIFGLAQAAALVPYFARLGISHLYLSPVTEARIGSTHGYDVIDHNRLREELGGEAAFETLRQRCVEAGLGLVLDFVPNHAGVGPRNAYWQDLLAYGPHSPYARFFDVDWRPLKPELHTKLLLPVLGMTYGEALDAGEIGLVWQKERLLLRYWNHRFALRPESYAGILALALPRLERTDAYWDAKELCDAYASVSAAQRERAEALRLRLSQLAATLELDRIASEITGARLHELLEDQFWRLSYWKTAGSEVNYRRFFDINELVALRMEDDEVFFDAHRLLGELLRREGVDGVRIDHIDGLRDPHGYLRHLRELGARHIWVEKILAPEETLPPAWPVEGTTGYDFLNEVLRLLNDPSGEAGIERAFRQVAGRPIAYLDVVRESKLLVMSTQLAGELFRLAYELDRLSEADYHTRDFTLAALSDACAEITAALDRYRTYLPHDAGEAACVMHSAVQAARQRSPASDPSVYRFIEQLLLQSRDGALEQARSSWVGRFQQYSAPVAAKGVEDTAFYRYVRLLALNEVGGDPGRFSDPPELFHERASARGRQYPLAWLATATHDHKRGEDLRMRLLVLAELARSWRQVVSRLERIARRHQEAPGPSSTDRFIFYQTLVALDSQPASPDLAARLTDYARKAAREAKVHTSWLRPNGAYEEQLGRFVAGMLGDPRVGRLIQPLANQLAQHGLSNSLAQLVLKLTLPGVPDFYQGTELPDLSLVDPDNRRPVDFAACEQLLQAIEPQLAQPSGALLRQWFRERDPRLKLYVMVRLLRLRRAAPALFGGAYRPLVAEGPQAPHFFAFAREGESASLAVVVTRLPLSLEQLGGPDSTRLALPHPGDWRELLCDQPLAASATLRLAALPLPVAVLMAARSDPALEHRSG